MLTVNAGLFVDILFGSGEICGGNWETAVGTAPSFWKGAKSFPPEM